jgi:hypothetical protein
VKDHTKIMGFATNRVVGKNLNKGGLSAIQMKGMSTLQNICGVKKTDEKIDQNALLKINALKSSDAHKKSKLLSELDDLPAKEEKTTKVNQTEKIMKTEEEKVNTAMPSENLKIITDVNKGIEQDNISLSSVSTTSTGGSVNTTTNATTGTTSTAAPKKKPGFSLKNLI